jgi:hypothetical protein
MIEKLRRIHPKSASGYQPDGMVNLPDPLKQNFAVCR